MLKGNLMNDNIVGLIPAAGKGTRLYPFPCPKELFPIGYQDIQINGSTMKRPKVISQYLIENIILAGAQRIFIILGEDKHDIMRYYGDGSRFGVDFAYLYQEQLHGMPFALNLANPWMNDAIVLFGMPDTIIEPKDTFKKLLAFHKSSSSDLTLGLFSTENSSKFGMVDIDDENNIRSIIDKPKQTTFKYMWGCGCWSQSFTSLMHDFLTTNPFSGREIVLGDLFMLAVEVGLKVTGLIFENGKYIDIGTVEELDLALKKFHL